MNVITQIKTLHEALCNLFTFRKIMDIFITDTAVPGKLGINFSSFS